MRYRFEENIIWITTPEKMATIEAEERKREQEAAARIEAERQRKVAEQEKKKQLEPLITEFIPLDFATADEIKQHIALSDRGTISTDVRTNTIIIKDIAEVIEEAKKTVKHCDTPVKQIMSEARIVEAGTSFTRELGRNNITSDVTLHTLNTRMRRMQIGAIFRRHGVARHTAEFRRIGISPRLDAAVEDKKR